MVMRWKRLVGQSHGYASSLDLFAILVGRRCHIVLFPTLRRVRVWGFLQVDALAVKPRATRLEGIRTRKSRMASGSSWC